MGIYLGEKIVEIFFKRLFLGKFRIFDFCCTKAEEGFKNDFKEASFFHAK